MSQLVENVDNALDDEKMKISRSTEEGMTIVCDEVDEIICLAFVLFLGSIFNSSSLSSLHSTTRTKNSTRVLRTKHIYNTPTAKISNKEEDEEIPKKIEMMEWKLNYYSR